MKIIMTLFFSR